MSDSESMSLSLQTGDMSEEAKIAKQLLASKPALKIGNFQRASCQLLKRETMNFTKNPIAIDFSKLF
jgi:hypothetical protein